VLIIAFFYTTAAFIC